MRKFRVEPGKGVVASTILSDISINALRKDIERSKSKLKNSKKFGENFGQSEVRRLRDKYGGLMVDHYSEYTNLINQFDEWCSEYVPNNLSW